MPKIRKKLAFDPTLSNSYTYNMTKSEIQTQIQAKKAAAYDLFVAYQVAIAQSSDLEPKIQKNSSEINDLKLKLAEAPEEVTADTSTQTPETQPENVV